MDTKERRPPAAPPAPGDASERAAFTFEKANRDDEGIGDLLRQLLQQGGHLAQQQAALVEAEVRSGIGDMKEAAAAMAGAAVAGVAALGVLLMGLAFLLGTAMSLWLATLIVGAAAMLVAYIMYASGKSKLEARSLTVDRTRKTLERAPDALSGHDHGDKPHAR